MRAVWFPILPTLPNFAIGRFRDVETMWVSKQKISRNRARFPFSLFSRFITLVFPLIQQTKKDSDLRAKREASEEE